MGNASTTVNLLSQRLTNTYQKHLETEAHEWYANARCKNDDSIYSNYLYVTDDRAAKVNRSFCNTCPVRLECLEYAIIMREQYGIWGGTTENQRKNLVRSLRRNLSHDALLENPFYRRQVRQYLMTHIENDNVDHTRRRRKR